MAAATHAQSLPGGLPVLGHFPAYARDPLGFATRVARELGGVVPMRLGRKRVLFLTDPAAIEEALVTRHRDFHKSPMERRVGVVVGEGILLSEGEVWRAHRRVVQPAFHHERITAWADTMVAEAAAHIHGWRDGEIRDVHHEMSALTLSIVARTLLGGDLDERQIQEVRRSGARLADHFHSRYASLAYFIPDWLPTPGNVGMRRAVDHLDRTVSGLITDRRASGDHGADVISMLLEASAASNPPLTDRELRDEVMTLFMAGHETTAVALSWAFYLLARHPAAANALVTELDEVLGGRSPAVGDLPRLRYTEAVVFEALRLYPPAYAISREAIRPTEVAGRPLPRGDIALVSVWATHRRADLFDSPSSFMPERWLDGLARRLPRGAFMPFAEGPRKCIGAGFAMQEAILVLATIAQRVVIAPAGPVEVQPRPGVTLRPGRPILVRPRPRGN